MKRLVLLTICLFCVSAYGQVQVAAQLPVRLAGILNAMKATNPQTVNLLFELNKVNLARGGVITAEAVEQLLKVPEASKILLRPDLTKLDPAKTDTAGLKNSASFINSALINQVTAQGTAKDKDFILKACETDPKTSFTGELAQIHNAFKSLTSEAMKSEPRSEVKNTLASYRKLWNYTEELPKASASRKKFLTGEISKLNRSIANLPEPLKIAVLQEKMLNIIRAQAKDAGFDGEVFIKAVLAKFETDFNDTNLPSDVVETFNLKNIPVGDGKMATQRVLAGYMNNSLNWLTESEPGTVGLPSVNQFLSQALSGKSDAAAGMANFMKEILKQPRGTVQQTGVCAI